MIKGITHPIIFNRTTKSVIVDQSDKLIHDYLRILLLSDLGECKADPRYGCNLKSLLYGYNDTILVDMVKDSIVDAIHNYCQSIRVTYHDITIVQDINKMDITINYTHSDNSYGTFSYQILKNTLEE